MTIQLTAIFDCSPERAFKAPILGDATRFLNGYLFQPPVIAFENDQTWGEVGGMRYPITKANIFLEKGILCDDQILERIENDYWKWTIFDFRSPSLFFLNRAVGEWKVKALDDKQSQVWYTYTFYPENPITRILTWLFLQIQWRGMMQKALKGIREQAESDEPFYYEKRDEH